MSVPGPALRADPRPPIERDDGAPWETAARWLAAAWSDSDPQLRHTRLVALLKRLLPTVGIGLLLLIAMWPRLAPLWERMRLAFPAIDLRAARELDMIKPRYAGVDREGHPFVVTAAAGRQLPDRQDLMSLREPRADLKTHSGATIVVTARTGIYQSQTQLLDLFGDVTLVHQNGTTFTTASARVEAAGGTAEGDKPVEGHGPSGDVKAQGFRVLDRGDKILFVGRSDLLLRSTKPSAPKSAAAPVGLPAPVAAAAARTAAEARPLLAAAATQPVRPRRPPSLASRRHPPVKRATAAAATTRQRAHSRQIGHDTSAAAGPARHAPARRAPTGANPT